MRRSALLDQHLVCCTQTGLLTCCCGGCHLLLTAQISGMLDGLMDADDNHLNHQHNYDQDPEAEGETAAAAADQRTEGELSCP